MKRSMACARRRSGVGDIERAKGLQIPSRLNMQLRLPFREKVDGGAKPRSAPPRSFRDDRLDPSLTSDEAKDARRLELVEGVQHNRVGNAEHPAI